MSTSQVRRIDRHEIPAAAAALASAFDDDPVCAYAWPHDASRKGRATRSFAAQIDVLWDRREVHTDLSTSCVAVWARPDEWHIPAKAVARMLGTAVRTRLRMRALLAYLATDKLHPEEPHWYLELLGTVPGMQGKGLGEKVLQPVLERADAEGIPVWAWSSNKRNLGFYYRQGFEVLDELPFAKDGPPIFPIRREPRG